VDVTVFRRRGGSAANVAALAAQNGTAARFVGQVGEDQLGARLIADLAIAGVDVRSPRGGRTGTIVVLVSTGGERTMLTDRGAAMLLGPPDDSWLDGVTILHLPAYSLTVGRLAETAAHLARRAKADDILVSIDASSVAVLRSYGVARFQSLLLELEPDVLLANHDEARLLGANERAPDGVALLVVHAGAGPAIAADADGPRATARPATARQARDTTGAGDAFAAGFLPALRRGDALEAALAAGHRCAARTLDAPGASVGAVVR
jgi:sugar/nucleoside kinase (ribokinase family)